MIELKTETSELPESRVRVDVEVLAAEVDRCIDRSARALGKEMRIPGFRKGKVPAKVVVQRLGHDAVLEQALRDSLEEWCEAALNDAVSAPVGEPSIDFNERSVEGGSLSFSIEIGVRPKAKLGKYLGLEVGRREVEVSQAEIEDQIEKLQQSMASLEPAERELSLGDYAVIDYSGTIEGEPFEGGQARDYTVELGSGGLIENFEEQLVGLSAGDTTTVEVTFPDDYRNEEVAGKVAAFDVTVKSVQQRILPPVDDELARMASEFDNLAELREDIGRKLQEAGVEAVEQEFGMAAIDSAVKEASIDVPESIVRERAHEMWHSTEHRLQAQGIDPESYLRISGKDHDQVVEEFMPRAEQAIKRESVLEAVAEAESIDVSDDEMIDALGAGTMAEGEREGMLAKIKASGREHLLKQELRARKALDLLVKNAKPISIEKAKAREKLWTPGEERSKQESELWLPERA